MTKRIIESERLYLKEFTANDVDKLFKLNCDPNVMKYIREPITDIKVIKNSINHIINYYSKYTGFGVWAGYLKSNNEFIGFFELAHMDNTDEIEVGYRLHKKYWGKGYATEMTNVLIDYGFNQMGLQEIVGITLLGNTASENVLKKAGLVYIKDAFFYEVDVKYFRITKANHQQKGG